MGVPLDGSVKFRPTSGATKDFKTNHRMALELVYRACADGHGPLRTTSDSKIQIAAVRAPSPNVL